MERRNWTRDELLVALQLYCVTPFGKIDSKNPSIVELSKTIGRTPSALALKMVNFVSLDPTIDRAGMGNVSKLDRQIWDEFFESIDSLEVNSSASDKHGIGLSDQEQAIFSENQSFVGHDRPINSFARDKQGLFRQMILASYDSQCALCDVGHAELLVASHIAPWSKNVSQRLNPSNGICLSALYDRAFDRGLIAFSDELNVLFSENLDKKTYNNLKFHTRSKLRYPTRFLPDIGLIKEHRLSFQSVHKFIS